mmetsp:Transcript_46128/g.52342  ORF Transcript_46128/g.52342 Transcript_46128/m.52342 type:complete len:224 (+) Transcript_46128:1625-2296(+)
MWKGVGKISRILYDAILDYFITLVRIRGNVATHTLRNVNNVSTIASVFGPPNEQTKPDTRCTLPAGLISGLLRPHKGLAKKLAECVHVRKKKIQTNCHNEKGRRYIFVSRRMKHVESLKREIAETPEIARRLIDHRFDFVDFIVLFHVGPISYAIKKVHRASNILIFIDIELLLLYSVILHNLLCFFDVNQLRWGNVHFRPRYGIFGRKTYRFFKSNFDRYFS